jgi:cell division protein FtsX
MRIVVSCMFIFAILESMVKGFTASADNITTSQKPSLAEANPLFMIVLVVGGVAGVVISLFALRALWRAKQYEQPE